MEFRRINYEGDRELKFFIVDDEDELYKIMFADLIKADDPDITEIPKFRRLPDWLNKLRLIHFSDRINRHLWLPFKGLWNPLYTLSKLDVNKDEVYWVVFLNGTLRNYYSLNYLKQLKKKHPNMKLAMIMYDSLSNRSTKRAVEKMPVFDKIFSFDKGDCEQKGFERILSTYSVPQTVHLDEQYKNDAFFVGAAENRLELLQETLKRVSECYPRCEFRIVGVSNENRKYEDVITYNKRLSYDEALMYSYNTTCIVEVVRPGQTGVSLRTCEAVVFNKKLLTNNASVRDMPFYDPNYICIFDRVEDIDKGFLLSNVKVDYRYDGCFSPMAIINRLRGET